MDQNIGITMNIKVTPNNILALINKYLTYIFILNIK